MAWIEMRRALRLGCAGWPIAKRAHNCGCARRACGVRAPGGAAAPDPSVSGQDTAIRWRGFTGVR